MGSRFREANQRIATTARDLGYDGWVPFLCECADDRCVQVIRVPIDEFEMISDSPGRFLAFPGHPYPAGIPATANSED